MNQYCVGYPSLWSIWVKAKILKNYKEWLIASACLPYVNNELFKELAKNRAVLLACPERENVTYYGKIASMIRSCKPSKIIVVTIDGSPHCFTLQASVNEAVYILGDYVEREHYVLVDGKELIKIRPESIRVARYLHLVEKLISKYPQILEELKLHSLEHMFELKIKSCKRLI